EETFNRTIDAGQKLIDELLLNLKSEVLRHLARGIIIFNFENAEVGEEKINYALETLEEFGGMKIKEFYQKKMEKYLKKSI
ncbi:hypothetical protein ACI3PF_07005, partial [Lactococcus lactis]